MVTSGGVESPSQAGISKSGQGDQLSPVPRTLQLLAENIPCVREAFSPWQTGTVGRPGSSAWTLKFDRLSLSSISTFPVCPWTTYLTILNFFF